MGTLLVATGPGISFAQVKAPPGMAVVNLPMGGRVAGGVGLEVSGDVSGTEAVGSVTVTPHEDADPAAMALEYQRQGRSPLKDALAAGVSPSLIAKMRVATEAAQSRPSSGGVTYDSFCVNDTAAYMEGSACVIRTYDNTEVISGYGIKMDQSQANGHESSPYFYDDLHKLGVKNQYAETQVTMVSKSPASDITDVTSCRSQSVGASYGGIGATIGGTICPDRWDATVSTAYPRYHKNEWQGESNSDREANEVTIFKIKDTYTSGYQLVLNWDVH